ncbi:MAG: 4Fe-4S binding protein [Muribaculaceae bacterium]|nr:4Fe-4S binding protein [Muribaculaceae bacterium]
MRLHNIRASLAVVFFTLITALLLDFTGTLHHWLGWMAKIQFLPAVLALNVVVIIALVVLTLVFGRIYCSVICPLGVMQDIISHIGGWRKKNRFTHSPALTWLRLAMLAVMVVAIVAGIGSLVALLAPYSSYGRIVNNLLQPFYLWGNNALAAIAEHYGSYAFYGREVWFKSLPTFIIALVTFVAIAVLAWRGGRTYCNTICPVGTVLGYLSKFSLLKIQFDTDKCKNCSLCTKNCKASCIDYKSHTVDYTRCVACGNCLESCKFGALSYGLAKKSRQADTSQKTTDTARRAFLMGGAIVAADTALAQAGKKVDGGLAVIEDKAVPRRKQPLTPPGSISAKNMAQHCTACQLCVAQCPNDVLRPSGNLLTLMQPTMSYERGYCRPECNRCSQVCPAGAIKPIGLDDKSAIQIGHAVWVKENCVVLNDGVACGNCARHCPSGAIMMVPSNPDDDLSPMVPAVDAAKCIGCGACEYVCPARPLGAIYVEGHEVHKII